MFKIWVVLVFLSMFAFFTGYLREVSALLVGILLISTFIKGYLVIEYFMGLKNITFKYRIIPTLWLLSVLSAIAIAYYLPKN